MAQGNEALAQMLLASLEADPTIRKTAEESLKQASKQPGECHCALIGFVRVSKPIMLTFLLTRHVHKRMCVQIGLHS